MLANDGWWWCECWQRMVGAGVVDVGAGIGWLLVV